MQEVFLLSKPALCGLEKPGEREILLEVKEDSVNRDEGTRIEEKGGVLCVGYIS